MIFEELNLKIFLRILREEADSARLARRTRATNIEVLGSTPGFINRLKFLYKLYNQFFNSLTEFFF